LGTSANKSIRLAVEVGDNGTREFLQSILKEEEDHSDWIEAGILMTDASCLSLRLFLTKIFIVAHS
jgi:bacterioferritin (cytochrome b1)